MHWRNNNQLHMIAFMMVHWVVDKSKTEADKVDNSHINKPLLIRERKNTHRTSLGDPLLQSK